MSSNLFRLFRLFRWKCLSPLAWLALSAPAFADNTRVTNPNAFSIEVGGRSLLWNATYDRVLSENLSAGLGIGSVSTISPWGSSYNSSAIMVPAFVNFYFSDDAGSFYVTGGASLVANSGSIANQTSSIGNLQFSTNPLLLSFGLGYEYRSDPGYLVRITAYGILGTSLIPWGGISFGYSF